MEPAECDQCSLLILMETPGRPGFGFCSNFQEDCCPDNVDGFLSGVEPGN